MDVNEAVQAAHDAFYKGPWGKMNARERGEIIYRYWSIYHDLITPSIVMQASRFDGQTQGRTSNSREY